MSASLDGDKYCKEFREPLCHSLNLFKRILKTFVCIFVLHIKITCGYVLIRFFFPQFFSRAKHPVYNQCILVYDRQSACCIPPSCKLYHFYVYYIYILYIIYTYIYVYIYIYIYICIYSLRHINYLHIQYTRTIHTSYFLSNRERNYFANIERTEKYGHHKLIYTICSMH